MKLNKDKIYRVWIYIIVIGFLTFLICGISYNIFCKDDINKKVNNMTSIVLSMEPIQKYKLVKIDIERGKALISRSVEATFENKKASQIEILEIYSYLLKNDWNVKIHSNNAAHNKIYLEAEKNKYIIIVNCYENKCHFSIHHDDFLYRHRF